MAPDLIAFIDLLTDFLQFEHDLVDSQTYIKNIHAHIGQSMSPHYGDGGEFGIGSFNSRIYVG